MVKIIALNTFKQLIRDKIAYSIIVLILFTIVIAYFAGTISLNQESRLVNSVVFSSYAISSVIIALFVSISVIEKERRERLLFFVLTRPLTKTQYFIGKWLGITLMLLIIFVLYLITYTILIKAVGANITVYSFMALAYVLLESILLTAVALTLSVWTKPALAVITFIMLYLIGHSSSLLLSVADQFSGLISYIIKAVYYIFPNIEKFNLRNDVNYLSSYSNTEAISVIAYFVLYLMLVLLIGARLFSKKDVV